jgi:integrase
MPRKPKLEKQTFTVVVDGKPIGVVLHPPAGSRKSWYAYWNGLVTSKSTGQRSLEDAVVVAESMVRNDGKLPELGDAVLDEQELEQIQRVHFAKSSDQSRTAKTLTAFFEAMSAFKSIIAMDPIRFHQPITQATAGICEAFQQKALTLPKNWRKLHPKSKKNVACISPNTVLKWTRSLQAGFERATRTAGKKCVRSVVDEKTLLHANPWNQFKWIERVKKPVRHFDVAELLSFLDYLENSWGSVTVGAAVAKMYLWSACRQDEITTLQWNALRVVDGEHHFEIVGKMGVERWFRIPDALFQELSACRTDSPYVFAAYNDQLRRFHDDNLRPDWAAKVADEFNPRCIADWFYDRLADWSSNQPNGHAHPHVFRKTGLQFAWIGEEDATQRVADDARVSESVLKAHYVKVELWRKSNRTFQRILAGLPPDVARRYGHVAKIENALEQQLNDALASKDWSSVIRLSAKLAKLDQAPTAAG